MNQRITIRGPDAYERVKSILLKEFDPNQPRDDDGKWSDEGGGSSSTSEGVVPEADAQQISQYMGDDPYANAMSVNYDLRVGEENFLGWQADMIQSLDKTLATIPPLTYHKTLFRGTHEDVFPVDAIVRDPAFVSATSDFRVAAEFADLHTDDGIVYAIHVPAGMRALDAGKYQKSEPLQDQKEWILARGAKFKRTGSPRTVAGGRTVIDLEYLGSDPTPLHPDNFRKAFDPNQPRDDDGKWSGGGEEQLDFPRAGASVDGLQVLDDIPNMSSIASSMDDYDILPGIREIPFSAFEAGGHPERTARTKDLAEQIKASGKIKPLIVVVESNNLKAGPYILEGGHRFDALQIAGKKSFPAKVVVDHAEYGNKTAKAYDPNQARDEKGRWSGDGGAVGQAQQKASGELKNWATKIGELQQGKGMGAIVAAHGQAYHFDKETFKGSDKTMHMCYQEAGRAAMNNHNLTYVEGYVSVHGVPIEHAWTVDVQGKVHDPTLKDGKGILGYFGVPLRTDYVTKTAMRTKVWGIFSHTNPTIFTAAPETYVKPDLKKYNENHDERGRFAESGGSELSTVYHGTARDILQHIAEEGLQPQGSAGGDEFLATSWLENRSGEAQRIKDLSKGFVFFTKGLEDARSFAAHAAKVRNAEPIVLQLSIPKEAEEQIEEDPELPGAFKFNGDIPPEWITGVMSVTGFPDPRPLSEFIKVRGRIIYVVVLPKEKGLEKYDPEQERVPAGSSEGGQFASGGGDFTGTVTPRSTRQLQGAILRSSLLGKEWNPEAGGLEVSDDYRVSFAIAAMSANDLPFKDYLYPRLAEEALERGGFGGDLTREEWRAALGKMSDDQIMDYAEKGKPDLFQGERNGQYYPTLELVESIRSEAGQREVVRALIDRGSKPGAKDSTNYMAVLDGTKRFRGDLLDQLADNLPMDLVKSSHILEIYSKDFATFQERFVNNWTMIGGTDAYRRGYVATEGWGPNEGVKGLWIGGTPQPELGIPRPLWPGEKVPSQNLKNNLQQMYANTQQFYKEKFATKKDPNPDLSQRFISVGRGVGHVSDTYVPAPIESWSGDKYTPDRFGKLMNRNPRTGYMKLTASVPLSSVLMSYQSLKGIWPEEKDLKGKKEYVVFGGALKDINREVVR